jgi:hypothetical protein
MVTIRLLVWIYHHYHHYYYDYSYEDGTVRVVYVDNVDYRDNLLPVTAVVRRTPMTEMTGDGTITATTMGRTSRGVIGIIMVMMMIIISNILLVGTSRTNHTTIIRIQRRNGHTVMRVVSASGCPRLIGWMLVFRIRRYILLVICCFTRI